MKIIIITFIFCSFMLSIISLSDGSNDTCLEIKDCTQCLDKKGCAFWDCKLKDVTTNEGLCQNTTVHKPIQTCANGGEWLKLEKGGKETCPTNSTNTTTITATIAAKTTITTTTTTTLMTTTSKATVKPITTSTSPNAPHSDTSEKLTGWTIFGIVASSLSVIVVLILVAWKKVTKLYQSRNPYRTLQ